MNRAKKIALFFVLSAIVFPAFPALAQRRDQLRRDVEFLCSELCEGRGTGTVGAAEAAQLVSRRFAKHGLLAPTPGYISSFRTADKIGRNVIGIRPGWGDNYIVIAAHYDNLGILEGNLYPGADSNASGVAVLLGLVEELTIDNYNQGIIFVALDAHQTMAGASDLLEKIKGEKLINPSTGRPIYARNITSFVNLDLLGSTMSPLHDDRPNFLIMLGNEKYRTLLQRLNLDSLDIGFDYYGSSSFTDMFLYRVGDQKVFHDAGFPVGLFTSGITMLTNKREDTPESLDYEVMEKRFTLIFHYFDHTLPLL